MFSFSTKNIHNRKRNVHFFLDITIKLFGRNDKLVNFQYYHMFGTTLAHKILYIHKAIALVVKVVVSLLA